LNFETLPSLAFSLLHLFGQNSKHSEALLFDLLSIVIKNLIKITSTSLISMLYALPKHSITAANQVFKNLQSRFLEEDSLTGEDFVTTIVELNRILDGQDHPI
jgi:hypothetical protein